MMMVYYSCIQDNISNGVVELVTCYMYVCMPLYMNIGENEYNHWYQYIIKTINGNRIAGLFCEAKLSFLSRENLKFCLF